MTQQIPKHSQTSAQNVTCDKTEETNRTSDRKIRIVPKIADFLVIVMRNGCEFFACFDAIIWCDGFEKACDPMWLPSLFQTLGKLTRNWVFQ